MTANENDKIGGILLAAGGSSRLGRPKQLISFGGRTLIRQAAETLIGSACDPVVVVLGAEFELSRAEIAGLGLHICVNGDWQTGMSSSIRAGLAEITRIEPELAAVVITLCDQPRVTSANIDRLVAAFRTSRPPIVAAEYGGTAGVPALFSRELFPDLLRLEGDKGARQIIRGNPDRIRTIPIEAAAADIDTSEDLSALLDN
jgi:molybdenum cofactor cytidylyltransferase